MRKALVIVGVILLIVGLLMMVLLWPMMGTISGDELEEKMANGESGTFTVVDEISQAEWDALGALGQEVMKAFGVDGPGTYVATVELTNGVMTNIPEYQKVPTMGGILGIVILIVGVILMIVGAATGRAAPAAPMQPPMEQQPMGQPPMGPPPYQQPPAQPPYPPQ